MKEYRKLEFEDKQEVKQERIENVKKSRAKQLDDLEKRKVKIRKIEREKQKQIQINKKQLE